MSWLSSITGVHISPKGVKIEPLKALGTIATLGSFGALGPVAGALEAIPGVGAIASGAGKIGSAIGSIPGASSLGDFLKSGVSKIPGVLGSALDDPLKTAGVVSGALDSAKARGLQTEAINAARAGYDSRAPLRDMALQGLLHPKQRDLSFYADSGNPYAKKVPAL